MNRVRPDTRYASVGADHVAYQVSGNAPIDVLFIPEFATHVEMMWDEPQFVRVLERLQSFGRLITFDKRGTGLSDPIAVADASMVENWVTDATAVLDAVGSRRAPWSPPVPGYRLRSCSPRRTRDARWRWCS